MKTGIIDDLLAHHLGRPYRVFSAGALGNYFAMGVSWVLCTIFPNGNPNVTLGALHQIATVLHTAGVKTGILGIYEASVLEDFARRHRGAVPIAIPQNAGHVVVTVNPDSVWNPTLHPTPAPSFLGRLTAAQFAGMRGQLESLARTIDSLGLPGESLDFVLGSDGNVYVPNLQQFIPAAETTSGARTALQCMEVRMTDLARLWENARIQ